MASRQGGITIRPLRSPRAFLDAQRHFYHGDPHFVPPLAFADAWQVDRRRNPFFADAEADFSIARRGRELVGRISAVRNFAHDRFHGDRIGFFGHFEATDREAAHALLAHAEQWLEAHGATAVRGPVDLSTNYRCGLLVDGDPGPPMMMMPYNPPWYAEWIEGFGFAKAKDLLALLLEARTATPERFERVAERIRERTGARIRPARMSRWREELDLLWRLYNRIWERNWGFVPMSEGEFRRAARDLKPIAVPELITFVEIDGQPVAFAINVPDANAMVQACNGRLLPFGWWRFLRARKRVRRTRVLTLGVLPEHRKMGLDALLLHYYQRVNPELGYPECEANWILEDNRDMLRVLYSLGAREYRRYRVFEKSLAPAQPA